MSNQPTTHDADLIVKLYDLRREAEMRRARNWWLTQFWPESADEILKIANALGTQENNWLRQVGGYWEMAASMAVRGAVNQELFLEPGFSGEMFFFFGKIQPFLETMREKLQNPRIFRNVETLIMSSEDARQLLKQTKDRIAARRNSLAEAVLAKAS
jgi:hypothetical protein